MIRRQRRAAAGHQVLLTAWALLACGGCGARAPVLDPDAAEAAAVQLPEPDERAYGSYLAYEHVIRAGVLEERGELAAAEEELRAALESDPDDFLLRTRLAEVLIARGELDRAERQLKRALAREPTAELSWIALAELHRRRGDEEAAERAARRALRVEPRRPEALLWLAERYRERGELERAAELYRQGLAQHPDLAAAHLGLGRVAIAEGHPAAAREHLACYLELDRSDPATVASLAEAHLGAGEALPAIELLELALGLDPTDAELRGRVIVLLLDLGRHRSAARHLDSLPSLAPGDVEGATRRACWWLEANRPYAARELLLSTAGGRPTAPAATVLLARIEARLGRLEVARRLIDPATMADWSAEERAAARAVGELIDAWPAPDGGCRAPAR